MLVKVNERQISFLFQEQDPFFEIGCRVFEQEHIRQMLPYQRKQQNGSEKLIFHADGENLVPLMDITSELGEKDLFGLLCGMISLNMKVEENGFMKKECIWYRYEHLYYDKAEHCIMAAILPITGELRYADGTSWYAHFEETATFIASYLSEDKARYVKKVVLMLKTGKMTQEEALEELLRFSGSDAGQISSVNYANDRNRPISLKLLYRGKDKELEFLVKDEDFLIGRNAEAADGVVASGFSKAVSRKHCLITKMNNKYFVQDLKSVNHTLVNGIMIPPYELMELENNDILSVADMEFRVTTSYTGTDRTV